MFDRMNGYAIERHSSNACDYLIGDHSCYENVDLSSIESAIKAILIDANTGWCHAPA